jgi:uncharacterized protein (TIGR00730 family)
MPATSSPPCEPPKPFTICVFCGANPGASPQYLEAAESLARVFASHNIRLVYGGGTVGLMGALARTLVSLSGPDSVHGIIPRALIRFEQNNVVPPVAEYGHTTIVEDMHSRKHAMAKEADAFVALPGGYGTMEELWEIVTWNQLGIHDKPVVVFNVGGFWDGVLEWVRTAVKEGFVKGQLGGIVVEGKDAEEVVRKVRGYKVVEGRMDLNWGNEGKA